MKTTHAVLLSSITMAIMAALVTAAPAAERIVTSQPAMFFGSTGAKASGDTIDLMGPGGLHPYRGDFETASARPGGAGLLTDGWYAVDETAPASPWHVDTYTGGASFPGITGHFAWCGNVGIMSCGGGDVDGGYSNNYKGILEFRKTVGAAATVRVQANLQYDSEPGYDFTTLQRRTALNPSFEPITGGQGQSWDGIGEVAVDYEFTYAPAELVDGTDIAVAFIFTADGGWSDGDCLWPTNGAARVDNITVTLNGVDYTEDFEDGAGPDWAFTPNAGVGDFARVWGLLGDVDDCASNYSKLIAFIDDGLVVPGAGPTVGGPGNDYGPPGGYIVNNIGGLLGPTFHLQASVYSPVMTWPDPALGGMTFAFDVYRHELLVANDTPGIFYSWGIRTTAGGDIYVYGFHDRSFVYYGGPDWLRAVNVVDDLVVAGATQCQVMMGVYELGWQFGYGDGTNGTPAPYFDNVSVKVYPISGPSIAVTELRMANDGFPAIGDIDLVNLGANSVRFDMAANIAARTHLRNDPGDSIWIDVTARSGGVLVGTPAMHFTFARRNPLFDAYRTVPASPVAGRVTRTASGAVVTNRFNFDLPDTGMLFPGDVLHYYFSATDNVAGDAGTSYAPFDRTGFGDPWPMAYPGAYTVHCLPTIVNAAGWQPQLLFWNDFGFRGGEDEWYNALHVIGLREGLEYDVFTTHGPSSGVGNGLGGRATVSQIDGYDDIVYCSGDLSSPTLSNGDYAGDPGNDLGLLNNWFTLGGRDLFMTGDDLANSLSVTGPVALAFLETRMGLTYNDGDVRDNIAGQTSPLVVKIPGNPVFTTADRWVAYGGCFGINDFDNVTPRGGAVRLAQFTAPGGISAPYPYAAATLMVNGTNRVISLNHDLSFIIDPAKAPSPVPHRVWVLNNALDYFGVSHNPTTTGVALTAVTPLAVACFPNPFNPSLTMRYTLARPGPLTMKVFDTRGALVRTLVDGHVDQLAGAVTWDGTDQNGGGVSSGLYFVETKADGQVDVRKVTMLK